ncbi:NAD(P)/FAD-dependent oxidoreductase [Caulobacter henricii]|uniref:D-amino acid oxidase n=1 Tax=Caulobacter henricii TaxID=69395 RepID=A0A0P0NXT4_9CAUL|nr:FAD-dependent oxidoreductase [Caulobacter henricii]ALL12897.1 D-amino acid oxidase [Caulobacter henricii]
MGALSVARIAVAGAGAFGSATALVLARAGFAVSVFDPTSPGETASGVAAGMLAPASEALFDEASSPHLALLQRARDHWPDFAGGLDLEISRHGVRIEGDPAWLSGIEARRKALGLPGDLAADGALVLAEDWRLDAPAALAALRAAAIGLGVRFESVSVSGYKKGVLNLSDGRSQPFETLVLATGASLRDGSLAPETAVLKPIKGQILNLDKGPGAGAVIRGAGVYLCPGASMIVGATMEHGRDDPCPDPVVTAPLLKAATALRPELASASVITRVGVRASTPDGLPLVGWSVTAGVMLAVGARRNGWLLAPLVADLVAAYLTGKDPGPEAAMLDARRFNREPEA